MVYDYSNYPDQIDTSNELPPTIDNVTPVKGEVVNRLRDAILAIESELGVDPSRTYGTVRARLDAMEDLLGAIIGGDIFIEGGSPTSSDKDLTPNATNTDEAATGLILSKTPIGERYVTVILNGISNSVGDGVKTKDCYFSRDSGITALSLDNLESGDELYWNSVISGIDLAVSDSIDFDYDV